MTMRFRIGDKCHKFMFVLFVAVCRNFFFKFFRCLIIFQPDDEDADKIFNAQINCQIEKK
jgi:hypothetical protein